MARQIFPDEATENARAALAKAGFTGLAITSHRTGTDYVTTTVRVTAGDADRVFAVMRKLLSYGGALTVRKSGKVHEVSMRVRD